MCVYHHHHHQVAPLALISLTLSRYSSLSSIAPGRFCSLHPVSVQSCYREVLVCRPTLICPCEGSHKRTSYIGSSLLLQKCPACLVRLIWMVLEIESKWPYTYSFVGCCFWGFRKITRTLTQTMCPKCVALCMVYIYVYIWIALSKICIESSKKIYFSVTLRQ